MDEIQWNKYTKDAIEAERLYEVVNSLLDYYPEEIRISKARLFGIINDDEAKLIRRFYN